MQRAYCVCPVPFPARLRIYSEGISVHQADILPGEGRARLFKEVFVARFTGADRGLGHAEVEGDALDGKTGIHHGKDVEVQFF